MRTLLAPRRPLPAALACAGALWLAHARAHGTTYPVGPSRAYHTPCAVLASSAVTLRPGDVVELDPGTYHDACNITASGTAAQPITLRGAAGARAVLDAAGMDLSGDGAVPRAVLQWNGASYWVVEHLELRGAHNTSSQNAAGARLASGAHDVVFRDLAVHGCDNGFFSSGAGTAFVLEASEVYENGAGDGQSHNLYANGSAVRLVGNYVHDSRGGENFKSRAHSIELLYNLLADASEYDIDLIQEAGITDAPDSNAVMIGNVVVRSPTATNPKCVQFGSDNPSAPAGRNGSLYAFNNTFVLRAAGQRVVQVVLPSAGTRVYFSNNVVHAAAGGGALGTTAATEALFTGSNNWLTTGIAPPAGLTATVTGDAPGFVGPTDYHLGAGSSAIDRGAGGLTYRDGAGAMQPGTPTLQFAPPAGTVARAAVGALDVGAFEFGSAPASDAGVDGGGGADAAGGGGDASAPMPDAATADGALAARDGAGDGGMGTASAGCRCRARPAGRAPIGRLACAAVALLALRRRRRARSSRR